MSNTEIMIAIAVMSLVNLFTRIFPFLFFKKAELPSSLEFVGKYFPSIILTILIFYTLKEIDFSLYPYGIKELGAILFTIVLHLGLKNYLISIFFGTIFYMGLVQYL
ncbi:branched-chain amino acid transporter permease [Halarcobacter ebronensis]|uniref:Branched-chain amino acid ABC transporter n=1 Tax=Halarcobacter ebronensis TaxID=1462615 RepID=A0A4Q1ADE5_9BACT|nr:AzlD domain-containing protein [Halarcobacter ebronensis]QKF83100.1 branched-chain amino acid transport protein, AzlD family [Halarcobacter ebronensis]RXK01403.1 branched-chain amino acid ABC transporter [Halarcobacter ebronensis]